MNYFIDAPAGGETLHQMCAKAITAIDVGVQLDLEADELDWYQGHLAHKLGEAFPNANVIVGIGEFLRVKHSGAPRQTVMGESMHVEVVRLAVDRIFTNCTWDME